MIRVLVTIFFVSVAAVAQEVDTLWSVSAGSENSSELAYGGFVLPDGSLLVAGGVFDPDSFRIVNGAYKVDADGNTSWESMHRGLGLGWYKCVTAGADGNYVFAGRTRIPDQPWNNDFIITKLDADGNQVWESVMGGENGEEAEEIFPAAGGGYWVVGTGTPGTHDNMALLKLSAAGDSLEYHTYGYPGTNGRCYLYDAIPTEDGGFLLAGNGYNNDDNHSQAMLLKVDSGGDSVWARLYGGELHENFSGIARMADGNYILSGDVTDSDAGESYPMVMIVDEDGDSLWSRVWDDYSGYGYAVVAVESGFALLWSAYDAGAGNTDAFITRFDARLDSLWTKGFGGSQNDFPYELLATADTSYVIIGRVYSGVPGSNAWVLKTTPDTFNYPLEEFERLAPEDDITVVWTEHNQVTFTWSASYDHYFPYPEYIFEASAAGIGVVPDYMVTTDTTMTVSLELPVEPLDDETILTWTVHATDRRDTIEATNGAGTIFVDYPGAAEDIAGVPLEFSLGAYPNPFNPSTMIEFSLPQAQQVELNVFDIQGRQVRTLAKEVFAAGVHRVEFHAEELPAGVYFARLSAGQFTRTAKLLLLK